MLLLLLLTPLLLPLVLLLRRTCGCWYCWYAACCACCWLLARRRPCVADCDGDGGAYTCTWACTGTHGAMTGLLVCDAVGVAGAVFVPVGGSTSPLVYTAVGGWLLRAMRA